MIIGLVLSAILIVLGVGTAHRQLRTLSRVRSARFLPSDERNYLKGQVLRRIFISGILILIGGMIAGSYISGMEDRAEQLTNKTKDAGPEGEAPRPNDPAERAFAMFYWVYWVVILVLVFLSVCLVMLDFWSTSRYWMAQYKRIKEDHITLLQRDLAVHRRQKDDDRLGKHLGNGHESHE